MKASAFAHSQASRQLRGSSGTLSLLEGTVLKSVAHWGAPAPLILAVSVSISFSAGRRAARRAASASIICQTRAKSWTLVVSSPRTEIVLFNSASKGRTDCVLVPSVVHEALLRRLLFCVQHSQ